MASITKEPGGRKTVQFIGADGRRRSIRLGKMSISQATKVKLAVENLAAAVATNQTPDPETLEWVNGFDAVLRAKLAKAGLIAGRKSALLGPFLDGYIASRQADTKPGTRLVYGHTRRNLIDFFGADKPLRAITEGDADAWRLDLVRRPRLSDNTIRRRCGIARQFFRAALRAKLIDANPFIDLPSAVRGNPEKFYFITPETAAKVMEHCPDGQWRLIWALVRFGGLRCPSEVLGLRWGDVDWAAGRMRVRSPKTEHHPESKSRIVPIFPEIVPHLREAFEAAEPGTEYVITRYRATQQNLRTELARIVERAGLSMWPKPFQNARSTRETELARTYPLHIVTAWIGNSNLVAAKHYLQVTDADFERAVTVPTSALQKAVHQTVTQGHTQSQERGGDSAENAVCDCVGAGTSPCDRKTVEPMGVTGLEPVTSRV